MSMLMVAVAACLTVTWPDLTLAPAARVLAAPAAVSATTYLPRAAELPGGFREQSTADVGGLLEPDTNVRRVFVSGDGSQTLAVEVAIRGSAPEAEMSLDGRINQLVRYQGWLFGGMGGLGEAAFRGSGVSPDGLQSQIVIFRVNAVAAEVALSAPVTDPALLDGVARIVERKIRAEPDSVATTPGFTATPRALPGKEPSGPPVFGLGGDGSSVGNTAGAPGTTDTIVALTLLNLDRPWVGTTGPRPPNGFNYLTVDIIIDVVGPTAANVLLEDFFAVALDGREWPPVIAREPSMRAGQAVQGAPMRGWLTFALPTDQQAIQLIWRLRSTVPIAAQGGDEVMSVPLTIGAMATVGLGTPAPPAGITLDPNSPVPPGSSPLNPAIPVGPNGAPTAPSAPSSSPSNSGPSTRPPRGGSGLQ
jgi:hypothetical protein